MGRLKEITNPWIPYPLVKSLGPVSFILFLTMLVFLLEKSSLNSGFLQWIGKYSFEIYLIHLPFMLYYDFLLFRKPLFIYFLLYLAIIIAFSYLMKTITGYLNQFLFRNISLAEKS